MSKCIGRSLLRDFDSKLEMFYCNACVFECDTGKQIRILLIYQIFYSNSRFNPSVYILSVYGRLRYVVVNIWT